MISIIAFAFVLSILILVHEFGHFLVAKRTGVKVERFSLGFGSKILGFKRGDTEYWISAIPLGGYVKMAGENPEEELTGAKWEFLSKSVSKRTLIVTAGPLLNYILAFIIFILIFLTGNPQLTTTIGGLMEGYPAEVGGLKVGDRIVALDGRPVRYWDQILGPIHERVEGSATLKISRDGEEFDVTLRPRVREAENIFGQKVKIGMVGIAPSDEVVYVKYNPLDAIGLGAERVWGLTRLSLMGIWRIVTGAMSFRESVSGPLGIFAVTSQAAKLGFVYLFQLMGVLSVCLAIFNLLPIPVLDGGHVLFLVIEKIRGRPLNLKVYQGLVHAGMIFLIALMVFVFYNDFVKFGYLDKIVGWWTLE